MIQLENITIRCGSFSLTGVSLSVADGDYAVLMGGTGQGKTTIIEAICGLRPIVAGRIIVDGVDVTRWKPADRSLGYVPQDLALFPTMTVREHLEFALRLRRAPRLLLKERVAELADVLDIGPLLDRRMRGLSGGEAQRVALGRALSFRPRVLLLDEPLNALDEQTRDRLCELVRTIQRTHHLTTLHITHSRTEAQLLADKLFVLSEGRIEERPTTDLARLAEAPCEVTASTNGHP
ncbi:MAG: ATP-binding cassette domain-containing protein [Pirellulales bacterium]